MRSVKTMLLVVVLFYLRLQQTKKCYFVVWCACCCSLSYFHNLLLLLLLWWVSPSWCLSMMFLFGETSTSNLSANKEKDKYFQILKHITLINNYFDKDNCIKLTSSSASSSAVSSSSSSEGGIGDGLLDGDDSFSSSPPATSESLGVTEPD